MWNEIRLLTFAKQIFHSEAISLGEAKFHSPKANFVEKRPTLTSWSFFWLWATKKIFLRFVIRFRTQTDFSEIFGVAECEIMCLRTLWNIAPVGRNVKWNSPPHICEANISQRSYFTWRSQISLAEGEFRWKKTNSYELVFFLSEGYKKDIFALLC